MQEILKGQNCFLCINITQVGAVQNAVKIDTHIISPSGVVSCVANGYDELKKVVGLIISADLINELGAYSIDLRLVFADAVIVVPTFAFAEAVEGEAPCYGISEVYVKIEGGEVVPSGSTTVEFVNREEFEQLSNKVDDLEERIGSGGGGSITIDTELSDTSNNAIANSAVTKALNSKQDTLTLTTKPNGNIVIGNLAGQTKEFMPATPSGDPMHYAYESLGGLYNASGSDIAFIGVYGETITHKSNHWRLNDLGDLTSEEMQEIFNMRYPSVSGLYLPMWFGGNANVRTNICSTHWNATYEMNDIFVNNSSIESISLAGSMEGEALPRNLGYAFFAAASCHTIINKIDLTYATLHTTTFGYCYSLKNIRLLNLHSDIVLSDSPLLSKESLLYMINNCASGVSFTIVVHPDVHDKCQEFGEWYEDINNAIIAASEDKETSIGIGE